MRDQAFIVSLYARGARRAADCVPDFFPTRSAAHAAGQAWVREAADNPEGPTAWVARYSVRRVWIERDRLA